MDADALSRKPGSGYQYSGETVRNMLCPSYAVYDSMVIQAESTATAGCSLPTLSTPIDWKHTQVQDPVLHVVLEFVWSGKPPNRQQRLAMSGDKLKILHDWKRLVIKDGVFTRRKNVLTERKDSICCFLWLCVTWSVGCSMMRWATWARITP